MTSLTLSVVIPLYNHASYIEETLSSVLSQTRKPKEIIVLDDGSTDDGWRIAEQVLGGVAGARVERQQNRGAHHALNTAIQTCTGDLIAVLNSDDSFPPEKIDRCVTLFGDNPALDLIFGRVVVMGHDSQTIERNETTEWLDRSIAFLDRCGQLPLSVLNENFVTTTSNMVFTKALWRRNGGFKNLRYCHDLDFLLASFRHGRVHFDRAADHVRYRVHPQNTIKETLARVHLEIAAIVANGLDRRTLGLAEEVGLREQRLLEEIIASKGLAPKIASLVPFRTNFDDRDVLYQRISGNTTPHFETEVDTSKPQLLDGASVTPFRVVIELSSFDRGGLEKVVLDCAIDFKRCGVQPLIVSCGKVGHLASVAAKHGIQTVELPMVEREAFYEQLLLDGPVDVAMSHFSSVGYPIFRKLGIPNITFIHNVYAMLRDKALDDFIANDALVDRYISVSQLATDYAVGKLGLSAKKIETIPNGLILEEHQRRLLNSAPIDRSDFGIKDSDYLFLNVASYNLHKAHYLMADAMRLVLKSRDDLKILCIGNTVYAPHVEQLREDLRSWGIDKNIIMPGYFEDVAPFHKAADAFLLPSLIEGWSIAMNEAMFYGKPMILSTTGGAPQVIENSDIGLLLPNEYGDVMNLDSNLLDSIGYDRRSYQTAPHLANAMTAFADNRAYWKARGEVGRKKVIEKYNFSSATRAYLSISEDLIAQFNA